MHTALHITRALKKLGTPHKAANSTRFFKSGKGQYGEGDVFVGVTVPEQRFLAKKYALLPFSEISQLLENKVHECRLTGLIILVEQYKNADTKEREKITKFYLAHAARINNWDLVDASASYILGAHLLTRNRDVLYKLVRSKNMWERRIAIVATHAFIRADDFADTLNCAVLLLSDEEDLMHKATGWMLREVGKRSRKTLVQFLDLHAGLMPRTALRYAIEHFSEAERRNFMHQT